MVQIKLKNGGTAIVDDVDFLRLNEHIWNEVDGYAVRWSKLPNGRNVKIYMHRDVLNFPRGFDVDHINGNKLDNRKDNLRVVTKQQNQFNRGAIKGSTSKYKGVSWFAKDGLWRASIRIDKKQRHIGLFHTEAEAAGAYNAMAILHHGEYARLNEVPTIDDWMERRAFKIKGRSKFRGVSLHKAPNKWRASISFKGRRIYIGIYDSEVEAAKAYNKKALELLGDKATLNCVLEDVINA